MHDTRTSVRCTRQRAAVMRMIDARAALGRRPAATCVTSSAVDRPASGFRLRTRPGSRGSADASPGRRRTSGRRPARAACSSRRRQPGPGPPRGQAERRQDRRQREAEDDEHQSGAPQSPSAEARWKNSRVLNEPADMPIDGLHQPRRRRCRWPICSVERWRRRALRPHRQQARAAGEAGSRPGPPDRPADQLGLAGDVPSGRRQQEARGQADEDEARRASAGAPIPR